MVIVINLKIKQKNVYFKMKKKCKYLFTLFIQTLQFNRNICITFTVVSILPKCYCSVSPSSTNENCCSVSKKAIEVFH